MVVFVALGVAAVVMEPLHKLPANWQLFFFIINATGMALVAFMLVGVFEPEFPRWLPPVANDGSTKGVRTIIPVVYRRVRSSSVPYQADLPIENPTH